MTNYEKAKEEGIKSFREQFPAPIKIVVNVGGDTDEVDLMELLEDRLSSFAEKIKDGVEKDKRETLTVDKFEYPKESMDLINKLLSDSQTIKE